MFNKRQAREALAGRIRRNRLVALLAVVVVAVAVYFLLRSAVRPKHSLTHVGRRRALAPSRTCPGVERRGRETPIGDRRTRHAPVRGRRSNCWPAGELDVAFIQGDVASRQPGRPPGGRAYGRAAAPVRQARVGRPRRGGLEGQAAQSRLARKRHSDRGARDPGVCRADAPDADYEDLDFRTSNFSSCRPTKLPDGIFAMTALPWKEMGDALVKQHGYRLNGTALWRSHVAAQFACCTTWSFRPTATASIRRCPTRRLHTVSARLLVVANRDVPAAAVERLLAGDVRQRFRAHAELPTLDS